MQKIISFPLALFLALGFVGVTAMQESHAAAGEPVDVALTATRPSTGANTKAGDTFSITYTLTNTGTEPYAPTTRTHIFSSQNVAIVSISDGLQCPTVQDLAQVRYQGMSVNTANQRVFTCHGGTPTSLFSTLNPGQAVSFTVTFEALADFPQGSTIVSAVNRPTNSGEGPQEGEESEAYYINWYWESYESGIFTWSTNWIGNNHVYFAYNTDPPADVVEEEVTATTAPSNSDSTSNESNTTVQGRLAAGTAVVNPDGTATESTSTLDGSQLTAATETSEDSEKKAEVALDIRNSLPDRIGRESPGTWEALLAGRYKNQFIGVVLFLSLGAGVVYILRKRYVKKIAVEREYRKALKAKSIKTFPLSSTHSPKSDVGA